MARLLLKPGDHGVVALVGPADVDAGQDPAGDDDADAEDDAEGDVPGDLEGEQAGPEGDEEDEAVVEDEGDSGELEREPVLAVDEVLELRILQQLQVAVRLLTRHRAGILPFGGGIRQKQ